MKSRWMALIGAAVLLATAMALPAAAQDSITSQDLGNLTYTNVPTPDGTVTLVDGASSQPAAPDSAETITVELTEWIAIGELNGQPAAAAILLTNSGGTGVFYSLAVVAERDGALTNVATTLLGDRITVTSLGIEDNAIALSLVTHGLRDAMCCATAPISERFSLDEATDALIQFDVRADAGGPPASAVTVDTSAVAPNAVPVEVPGTPYDVSQPPGPTGSPLHTFVDFGDEDGIWIFPVNDFTAQWDTAGNPTVTTTISSVDSAIANAPTLPTPPFATLVTPGVNDLATQIAFVDFASGSGYRFVGRYEQSANPVCGDRLSYYYQGVTTDGQYYVTASVPVTTTLLNSCESGVSQEDLDAVTSDSAAYMQQVTDELNAASPSDFTPDLSTLDAMMQSLTIAVPAAVSQPALVGTTWQFIEFQSGDGTVTTVDNPASYTMTLNADGSASYTLNCNTGAGTYTLDESVSTLTLGPIASTMMACADETMATQFAEWLSQVVTYVERDGMLYLNLAMDSGNMVFAPAAPANPSPTGVTGVTWQWATYTDASGVTQTVESPAQYTLLLNEDGTLSAQADCNQVTGTFTMDGTSVTIMLGASTAAACPEGSLDAQYLQILSQFANVSVMNGDLYVYLQDGTQATFTAQSAQPALVGTTWQFIEFQSGDGTVTTVDNPASYTMTLNADGSASYTLNCNTGAGTYTLDQSVSTLTLGPIASTMMACADETMATQFADWLSQVVTYVERDGMLYLNLAMDSGNMVFAPAPQAAVSADGLIGTTWQWTEFQGNDGTVTTVDNPVSYTLLLNADGSASFQLDCNSGFSGYTLGANGELSFGPIGSTMMACPEGSLATQYTEWLGQVVTYVLQDGNLYLNLMMDAGNLVFVPASQAAASSAPALVGTTWQFIEFQGGDGTVTTVDNPASYTMTLNADGSASYTLNCNTGAGTYTLDQSVSTLTLGPIASTMMACADETMATQFADWLSQVVTYVEQDGMLYLNLAMDSGNMVFAPAAPANPSPTGVTGVTWQWATYTDASGVTQTVESPAQYTLLLNEDGTLSAQADCNQVTGTYTINGTSVTIMLGATTDAFCSEESLDAQYLQVLSQFANVSVMNGDLYVYLQDGTQATFTAQ